MDISSNGKILTIDDDAAIRNSVATYLEDSGFIVVEAENGKHGVEVFQREQPDLVLSDMQMPEMDGLEVITKINELSPTTPIIIVSGGTVMEDAIRALRLGAWDYLMKPVNDLAVLEHAVCKALERSRLLEENKRYRAELEKSNTELNESLQILQEDQEAARHVQQKLLPETSLQLDKLLFKHEVTPSLYLSGDFVDYFPITENEYGFYIADVSGHGAPSAFVTVLLKTLLNQLRAQFQLDDANQTIMNPELLLVQISDELITAELGKYLTMVYGVLDVTTRKLTYSIGGHFPNPILKANGETKYLEGNGFPVGVVKGAKYDRHTIDFPEDAELVFFSDGILEIISEDPLKEKEQQLINLVADPEFSVDKVMQELNIADLKDAPDDITILSVQWAK